MTGYKILLIDDEDQVLNSLKRVLRRDDYVIYTSSSAEAAQSIVRIEHPHLIVCDYQLGGMNGLEFLKGISKDYPEIITILLTGHADLKVAIEAINKAVLYKFIIKPWDNDELKVTVQRALDFRSVLAENKKLMNEISKRDEYIKKLDKEYPGITTIKKDAQGRIILEP